MHNGAFALKKFGLEPEESRVYLALLGAGALSVLAIAQRAALHRPTVYRVLPALLEKGLVTKQPRGKRIFYQAEPPTKLKSLLESLHAELDTLLPELEQEHQQAGARPVVKYLEGPTAISFVLSDIVQTLKRGETFYRYSSSQTWTRTRAKFLPREYLKTRDAKALQRFVITNAAMAKTRKKDLNRAEKVIPEKYGLFEDNVTQIIYGNKVAFLDYNTATAILIESPIIAGFQTKIFKIIYDLLPTPQR